jgi:hypothetical protein
MMEKNKKKLKKNEELVLHIEVADKSSELVMRLESILKEDITTHKLPTDFNSTENKGDAK